MNQDWNDPTEADLMTRVAGKDCAAFEQLYDRYAPLAFGVAMRLLGDRTQAEDAVQGAFWRAWQRADTFDSRKAGVRAWLVSIVHHHAIDVLRHRQRLPPPVEIDATLDGAHDLLDAHANVAETVWHKLRGQHMRAILSGLPTAQRQVLELAYFEGLTHQQIALKLKEPLGTVHTRARLGLGRLRGCLDGELAGG